MVWVPWSGANVTNWKSVTHFDRAALQVNYAFKTLPISQFRTIDSKFRQYKLHGVEIELGKTSNPNIPGSDPELTSAKSYLSSADMFNWTRNSWNVYYHGTVITNYATSSSRRVIYDLLYRRITVNPRDTVALRSTRGAVADAWVEQASGRTKINHGTAKNLVVGTNASPNALRSYVKFDIKAGPAASQLLAAHLNLGLRRFEYGAVIEDGQLYYVTDSSWKESTLTAANQPASSTHQALNLHRVVQPTSYPFWHRVCPSRRRSQRVT